MPIGEDGCTQCSIAILAKLGDKGIPAGTAWANCSHLCRHGAAGGQVQGGRFSATLTDTALSATDVNVNHGWMRTFLHIDSEQSDASSASQSATSGPPTCRAAAHSTN